MFRGIYLLGWSRSSCVDSSGIVWISAWEPWCRAEWLSSLMTTISTLMCCLWKTSAVCEGIQRRQSPDYWAHPSVRPSIYLAICLTIYIRLSLCLSDGPDLNAGQLNGFTLQESECSVAHVFICQLLKNLAGVRPGDAQNTHLIRHIKNTHTITPIRHLPLNPSVTHNNTGQHHQSAVVRVLLCSSSGLYDIVV